MLDAENRAQFERGVGMALSALVSIPVLPIDRKQLATTIASATLGVGAQAATRFVEALLDQLSHERGRLTLPPGYLPTILPTDFRTIPALPWSRHE